MRDIGDNDYEREYISIYKVKEPELNFVDQETRDWEVFHFQYPNEKFNAESMLIDAITRELVIGEKYASKKYTLRSEGFLYKVALLELKISPIMYFVIHKSVVLSKILKIIVPF